ncbi:MAG: aromatic-ring-hydroxylating dioxygenase subunit beta [Pseudomonadota bacterium]
MFDTDLSAKQRARLALEDFFADYVACLDEDRLEEWPGFFTEDATYSLFPRENYDSGFPIALFSCTNNRQLQDRITSHRKANIFPFHWNRHIISSLRITALENDKVETTSNYAIFQTRQDGESKLFQVGQARDEIVATSDGLKFKSRTIIYDTSRVQTLFVTPI